MKALKTLHHTIRLGCAGSTLVEVAIAATVVVMAFSGVFMLNAQAWGLLRAGLESTASMRVLNGRAEQLRSSTWTQLTDSSYLTGTLLAVPPDAGGDLGSLNETLAVYAYPITGTALTVTRSSAGLVSVTNAGPPTLPAEPCLRIDLTATWAAKGGRARTRQMSLVLSSGGVTGRH